MLIWQLLACLVTLKVVCAYPQAHTTQINQRLSADKDTETELEHLLSYGRTLSRLRRALEQLEFEDQAVGDDMELAEINVFRPLFRYRAEIARQVKNNPQQQFG
ncbi:CG34203 [Drosophila busckii]|uniref:CG34203 n=1 Tax=Drosophila busckii TaxID=30019 RepID=A0A0M4EHJ0_DROBS|nr:uncharacterized protein LOC108595869 [Drosophila busckii]ALC42047.1 CG34203 [Drosophila busckii]